MTHINRCSICKQIIDTEEENWVTKWMFQHSACLKKLPKEKQDEFKKYTRDFGELLKLSIKYDKY